MVCNIDSPLVSVSESPSLLLGSFMMPLIIYMRQSKLDCLFSTIAILLLHVGRWFVFIIHCHFLLLNFENLELYNVTQHSSTKRFVKVMLTSTLRIDQAIIARFASTTKMHRVRDVADMF